MSSFYSDFHGKVNETCIVEVKKDLITEDERLQLISFFREGKPSVKDFVAHDRAIPILTTKRARRYYDERGELVTLMKRSIDDEDLNKNTEFVPLEMQQRQAILPLIKRLRYILGAKEGQALNINFAYTVARLISYRHCEHRSPSLNICLIDSGTEVLFFDDDEPARCTEIHFYGGELRTGVIYNTGRWHLIRNLTYGERLVLSVNLDSESTYEALRNPFLPRAYEIRDRCFEI